MGINSFLYVFLLPPYSHKTTLTFPTFPEPHLILMLSVIVDELYDWLFLLYVLCSFWIIFVSRVCVFELKSWRVDEFLMLQASINKNFMNIMELWQLPFEFNYYNYGILSNRFGTSAVINSILSALFYRLFILTLH